MLWLIRTFFKLAIYSIILLTIVLGAMVMFVNPNNYKTEINGLLKKYTGHNLQVNGNITWTFWPLSFDLQNIQLDTPSLEIKSSKIVLDPYTVFSENPVIETLELKGLTANLTRIAPVASLNGSGKLTINSAVVNEAIITFKNDTQNWELRDGNANTKNIVLGAVMNMDPMDISGTLVKVDNPVASFNLQANLSLNTDQQSIILDPLNLQWNEAKVHGKVTISQDASNPSVSGAMTLDPIDLDELLKKLDPYYTNSDSTLANIIKGQVTYTYSIPEKVLDLSNIDIDMDDGGFSGNFKMGMIAPYKAEFNISTEKLNLQPLMVLGKAMFPSVPADDILPIDVAKTITILGKISGSNLMLNPGLVLDSINAELFAQDGLIQIYPFSFESLGAKHNLSLYIDTTNDLPVFKFSDHVQNMALAPWMKLLKHENVIDGMGDLKINLEGIGNTQAALKQSVTGNLNLNLNKGNLYGIDINKLMEFIAVTVDDVFMQLSNSKNISVRDLLKPKISKWSETQKNNPVSSFDTLEFKAEIKQSQANSSFILASPDYEFKGTGEFNIMANDLKYNGSLTSKSALNSKIEAIGNTITLEPLTILLSGSFERIIYNPEIEPYATTLLEQANESLIKVAASSMVAASVGNEKTSLSADDLFIEGLKGLAR